jgi:hypothetical protein
MDQYVPPAPSAASALLRPGRFAALLVLAGLAAGTLLEPNNPLRAFLRPVLSPSEPPIVADLFFGAALAIVLVDRIRAGLAVAAGLQLGGSFGAPGFSFQRAKRLLLARRGDTHAPDDDPYPGADLDDPLGPPPGGAAPADRGDELDEDPWR